MIFVGDASDRIEASGGTTNVPPDRENITTNLKENGEEKCFILCK